MSQSGKRDATAAFEGTTNSSPHPSKRQRQRKRKSPKGQEQDTPAPVSETTTPVKTPKDTPAETPNLGSISGAKAVGDVALDQEPASNGPTTGLTLEERQERLSESMSKHHTASAKVKQDRRENMKASPLKNTAESKPSKSRKDLRGKQYTASNTPNQTPRKSGAPTRTPLKRLAQEERAAELSKRLKERDVLLKAKREDDASNRLEELLNRSRGNLPEDTKQLVSKRVRDKKKKSKPAETSITRRISTKSDAHENGWATTQAKGGMFIDQDPLLTVDGQHLILPTHAEIQVYSTKTSLLIRSMRMQMKSDITSCSLSTVDPNKLYVSNAKGVVSIWDWTSGAMIAKFDVGKGVRQVLSIQARDESEGILLLQDEGQGSRSLVYYLANSSTGSLTTVETIFQGSVLSPCVSAHAEGAILVAYTEDKIIIGQSETKGQGQLTPSYIWREVTVPGLITSLDSQVSSGTSKTSRKVPYLDVVAGLKDGVIMHYEDILFKLIGKEKKRRTNDEDLTARKHHWHRTAVNTVKWSRDKNYIISGGNETVLVIWQLDSNQRQYLPHLSTPILNLTVSAAGSSYALRLADNSIMILSTADLLPSTNITGLALGPPRQTSSTLILHPRMPNHLLAAIPTDVFRKKPSTFLQIYDVDSSLQLTRQALTRNMITASNVAPTGRPVKEPFVAHMDISHDGKWLATVDEWTPNEQDIEALYISADDKALRGRATETTLRLWLWSDISGNFEQVTRIDRVHSPGLSSVLQMAFNPVKLELATIGADATICIWTPKARHRNGVPVKSSANEPLFTWTSSRTVRCDHEAPSSEHEAATSAALAYAEDGSVIAASWSFPTLAQPSDAGSSPHPRFTHLVDPSTGSIVFSAPSLLARGPGKHLFHNRYLLSVSSRLSIFDTITCQEVTSPIQLDEEYTPPKSAAPLFLCRNKFDGTFAVGVSKSEWPRSSKVLVLQIDDTPATAAQNAEAEQVRVVYQSQFPGMLKGLLALTSGPGYLLIDDRNQTRILRHAGARKGALALTGVSAGVDTEDVTRSLDSMFGRQAVASSAAGGPDRLLLTAADGVNNAEATTTGGLDAVLRFSSSAQAPSPAELFQRVVGVMARG